MKQTTTTSQQPSQQSSESKSKSQSKSQFQAPPNDQTALPNSLAQCSDKNQEDVLKSRRIRSEAEVRSTTRKAIDSIKKLIQTLSYGRSSDQLSLANSSTTANLHVQASIKTQNCCYRMSSLPPPASPHPSTTNLNPTELVAVAGKLPGGQGLLNPEMKSCLKQTEKSGPKKNHLKAIHRSKLAILETICVLTAVSLIFSVWTAFQTSSVVDGDRRGFYWFTFNYSAVVLVILGASLFEIVWPFNEIMDDYTSMGMALCGVMVIDFILISRFIFIDLVPSPNRNRFNYLSMIPSLVELLRMILIPSMIYLFDYDFGSDEWGEVTPDSPSNASNYGLPQIIGELSSQHSCKSSSQTHSGLVKYQQQQQHGGSKHAMYKPGLGHSHHHHHYHPHTTYNYNPPSKYNLLSKDFSMLEGELLSIRHNPDSISAASTATAHNNNTTTTTNNNKINPINLIKFNNAIVLDPSAATSPTTETKNKSKSTSKPHRNSKKKLHPKDPARSQQQQQQKPPTTPPLLPD